MRLFGQSYSTFKKFKSSGFINPLMSRVISCQRSSKSVFPTYTLVLKHSAHVTMQSKFSNARSAFELGRFALDIEKCVHFLRKPYYLGLNVLRVFQRTPSVGTKEQLRKLLSQRFHNKSFKSTQRIGPHNHDVFSVLVGNLLGDAYAEMRSGSTRITLHLGSPNVEYAQWLSNFYYERGYSQGNPLIFRRQLGEKGKVYFSVKIHTFSFTSLNWLRLSFYRRLPFHYRVSNKRQNLFEKVLPVELSSLLSPLALSIWAMDDGSAANEGFRISTQSFSRENMLFLQKVLLEKYQFNTTLHISRRNPVVPVSKRYRDSDQQVRWILYFPKIEASKFYALISPYIHKSMEYKFRQIDKSF